MARLHTNLELAELVRPPEALALEALHRNDMTEVRSRLREMATGHAGLDALCMHALARKAGKLRVDFGETRARETLQNIGAQAFLEEKLPRLRQIKNVVVIAANDEGRDFRLVEASKLVGEKTRGFHRGTRGPLR